LRAAGYTGVDGRHRGRSVVCVIDPATAVDHDLGVAGEDRVGLEGPDLAHQHLAQGHVVDQVAVGLVQELTPL